MNDSQSENERLIQEAFRLLDRAQHLLREAYRKHEHVTQQDALPEYVERISQCVLGADVADLTLDWARVLFDLSELRRRRDAEASGCEACKSWLAIGKAFCGDCGRRLPELDMRLQIVANGEPNHG